MSDETMEQLKQRHQREIRQLIKDCPHCDVKAEEGSTGNERIITIRCVDCGLNILGWSGSKFHKTGKVSYVRGWIPMTREKPLLDEIRSILPVLKKIHKLGRCAEGGESVGNRTDLYDHIKSLEEILKNTPDIPDSE